MKVSPIPQQCASNLVQTRELEANIRLDTGERKPEELQVRVA